MIIIKIKKNVGYEQLIREQNSIILKKKKNLNKLKKKILKLY